jgi:hypothetical protein
MSRRHPVSNRYVKILGADESNLFMREQSSELGKMVPLKILNNFRGKKMMINQTRSSSPSKKIKVLWHTTSHHLYIDVSVVLSSSIYRLVEED